MIEVGTKFRLISRTNVFEVVKVYEAAGFIPSVVGHDLKNRLKTCARIADIIVLP